MIPNNACTDGSYYAVNAEKEIKRLESSYSDIVVNDLKIKSEDDGDVLKIFINVSNKAKDCMDFIADFRFEGLYDLQDAGEIAMRTAFNYFDGGEPTETEARCMVRKYNNPVAPKQKAPDKTAGCIDVNGKRIDVKKLVDFLESSRLKYISNKITGLRPFAHVFFNNKENSYQFYLTDGYDRIFVGVRLYNAPAGYPGWHSIGKNYANVQTAIRALIEEVNKCGNILDNIDGIIWDINDALVNTPASQSVQHSSATCVSVQRATTSQSKTKLEIPQLTAVGRFLDSNRKIVGLALSDGKQYRLDECIKLAKAGKIKNVKAISREGVNPYLQGNGISLESLPYKQG